MLRSSPRFDGRLRPRGFTLIELMIALAILAILTAIALPVYRSYILRTHRTDALATLAQDQATLERCYAVNFKYTDCGAPGTPAVPPTSTSPQGFYTITMTTNAAGNVPPNYQLTAVPSAGSPQQADTTCATIGVDQANQQTATDSTGADSRSACWHP